MKQLNTIQKIERLNDIFALDEPAGPGGACHLFQVCKHNTGRISEEDGTFRTRPENMLLTVQMQCGAVPGVTDADLLEIVRDRFRAGMFKPGRPREYTPALIHVEEALMWLNRLAEKQATRGVLGTEQD